VESSLNHARGGVCSIWHIMRIIRRSELTEERQQQVPRRPKGGLARDDSLKAGAEKKEVVRT
jgi:hypothetical protein